MNYVLTNITLIDGKGNLPAAGMYIQINGKSIEKIGAMHDYKSSRAISEYDLPGHYIMPGMIDAHVHLAGGRGSGVWGDTEILAEPGEVRAMRSVYEAQKMLKHGFTTVRDISRNGLYLKRIFNDDLMPGPKIVACGPGLARTGGHCDSPQFDLEYVKKNHFWVMISDGTEECRRNVRKILREGADQIKFWATGGGNWGTDRITDTHYTQDEMNAICEEAHMIKGTLVCAHCETTETIEMAIRAGVDTIEHGEALTEELAEKMVEKGIALVPTIYLLANWYDFISVPGVDIPKLIRPDPFLQRDIWKGVTQEEKDAYHCQVTESFCLALKKGVKIALGSDTVYEPSCEYGRQSLNEFAELVSRGMTIHEAIRAATENGAYACGLSQRLGTLEEGKDADILILEKDPAGAVEVLANHKNIKYIILNGRLTVENGRFTW